MNRRLNILGHVGYALLATGTFLVANGISWGWPLRFVGTMTWCYIGVRMHASSMWVWAGCVFGPIELVGWFQS